jgi:hypothetical protein
MWCAPGKRNHDMGRAGREGPLHVPGAREGGGGCIRWGGVGGLSMQQIGARGHRPMVGRGEQLRPGLICRSGILRLGSAGDCAWALCASPCLPVPALACMFQPLPACACPCLPVPALACLCLLVRVFSCLGQGAACRCPPVRLGARACLLPACVCMCVCLCTYFACVLVHACAFLRARDSVRLCVLVCARESACALVSACGYFWGGARGSSIRGSGTGQGPTPCFPPRPRSIPAPQPTPRPWRRRTRESGCVRACWEWRRALSHCSLRQ